MDRFSSVLYTNPICLPPPLRTALFSIGGFGNSYWASILLMSNNSRVYSDLSYNIEKYFKGNEKFDWIDFGRGTGYVLLRGEGVSNQTYLSISPVSDKVGDRSPNGRIISLGDNGAEPRTLGDVEQFSDEMSYLFRMTNVYLGFMLQNAVKLNKSVKSRIGMDLHFNPLSR